MADLDRAIMLDANSARAYRARGELLRHSGGNLTARCWISTKPSASTPAMRSLSASAATSSTTCASTIVRSMITTKRSGSTRILRRHSPIAEPPIISRATSPLPIQDYDQAIRLDPNRPEDLHQPRCGLQEDRPQRPRALPGRERKAIRLDPTVPEYFGNRGLSYAQNNDYDKAIADYDEAIRLRPKANFLANRGDSHRYKGDLDRAMADYERSVAARFELRAGLQQSRGVLRRKKGDRVKALADYDAALRVNPRLDSAITGRKSLALEIERAGAQVSLQSAAAKAGPSFDCATAKRPSRR